MVGRNSVPSSRNGKCPEVVRGDLLNIDRVRSAMSGIEMVHHLANPDIRLGTEVTDTDLRQGTLATYNVLEVNEKGGRQQDLSHLPLQSTEKLIPLLVHMDL